MVEDEIIGGKRHNSKPKFNSKNEEEKEGIPPHMAVELVINILSRLPASFLMRCRQVCKAWCEVIDSLSFAHTHQARYTMEESRFLFYLPKLRTLYSYQLKFDESDCCFVRGVHPMTQQIWNSHQSRMLYYLGYGLFGFQELLGEYRTYLHNPTRGQTWMLPPTTLSRSYGSYGLGFDSTTNTYKLVHVYQPKRNNYQTEVYTLGTSSWRRISAVPPSNICFHLAPVPAYGDIHWKRTTVIVSFDLKREEFKTTPLPCPRLYPFYHNLFDWRGTLAVVQQQPGSYLGIWVLKDYENSRWEKDYNITPLGCLRSNIVVNAWNDGMIIRNAGGLFYYDPKSGGLTRVGDDPCLQHIKASRMINYTANLISLKNYGDLV